jgi:hypothetical protein
LRLEGLSVSGLEHSFTPAKFDLSLMLQERDGSFSGYLEFPHRPVQSGSGGDVAGSVPGPGERARLGTGLRDFFAFCFLDGEAQRVLGLWAQRAGLSAGSDDR